MELSLTYFLALARSRTAAYFSSPLLCADVPRIAFTTITNLMKATFSCFLLLAVLCGHAQSSTRSRKIVPILTQQNFFLNGGLRGNFGGQSRAVYQVTLPPGTVEWFYTVSTAPATPNQSLNLVPQLTRVLDPTGATSIMASMLLAPTGSNSVDCLVMLPEEERNFLGMADISTIRRFSAFSHSNYRSGVTQVNGLPCPATYILGFRNPAMSSGIGVSVEVAAVVEETVANPEAERAMNYGNLGWKAYQAGDVARCIDLSKKALELDKSLGYVKANLGLCYLLQSDDNTATEYYMDALADFRKMPNKVLRSITINACIRDINDALKKQPAIKGAAEIKSLFNNELLKSLVN